MPDTKYDFSDFEEPANKGTASKYDFSDFEEPIKKKESTPSPSLDGSLPQNAIDINNPFKGMGKPVAEDKWAKIKMGDFKPITTDNTRTIIPKLGSNQPEEPTIADINKAIEHRANTSTESAESVVKRFDDGDLVYDKESGKLKQVGSWLDNLGQGIKNTMDDIGLSLDIEVAKMNKNDNELKYYLNQRKEAKDKELESTYNAKGDFFKALPQEAGSFLPYVVGGALGIDAPMMGLSHSGQVANEIWNEKPMNKENEALKLDRIKNTSMDEKMIGTLQMALFGSLGVTDSKQAKELLSKYAPTSKMFDASKNILKALPLDMAKVAGIGAGGQILSNLTQENEGREVDWRNVPEAAESFAKMHLLFEAPKVFMAGVKVLADAKNNGVDKSHPEWYNKYNADVQQQLHEIVSSPDNIYNKLVGQLKQHENEPIAQDALTKIQTFRDYYKQLPSDLSPKSKEKALSILQLKTEAMGNAQNATESGIKSAYEQRAKTYDGLLQKLFEGEKVEDKEVLGLPTSTTKTKPTKTEKNEPIEIIPNEQGQEQALEILNPTEVEKPITEKVSEVVGEPKEVETKTETPKVEETSRQIKINDLIDKYNNKKLSSKDENAVKVEAEKLGLFYDKKAQKIVDANGNKIQKREPITNKTVVEGFDRKSYSKETNDAIDFISNNEHGITGFDIRGTDGKRLSPKQQQDAINSIKEGKPNYAAKSVFDFIEQAHEKGGIELEDVTSGKRDIVPIKEYFDAIKTEEDKIAKANADDLENNKELEQSDEYINQLINDYEQENGITNSESTPTSEEETIEETSTGTSPKENGQEDTELEIPKEVKDKKTINEIKEDKPKIEKPKLELTEIKPKVIVSKSKGKDGLLDKSKVDEYKNQQRDIFNEHKSLIEIIECLWK